MKTNHVVKSLAFLLCLSNSCVAEDIPKIVLDGDNVLNTHANQVGIWIDSRQEKLSPQLIEAIRDLRLKSIRYGWQFAVFDREDTKTQKHSPQDQAAQGFFADERGRMYETIGPAGIGELLDATNTAGFAVCNTDGIQYLGEQDAKIKSMTPAERLTHYSGRAADWARWGKDRGFDYFEIGNENDLSGHGEVESVIAPWSPEKYSKVARRYLTAIQAAHPNARCGINGGLKDPEFVANWFKTIVATEPTLASELDFIVAHKYEFWLDFETWSQHAEWNFGRVNQEYLALREQLFPTLPIHVTELGSWKQGENVHHYRALLAVEMLGNVYSDAAVEHVQFWPSRWTTEGGVFLEGDECRLSPMGLGLKAYSKFAQPVLIANGSAANVRYFASRGLEGGLTIWLINHATESRTIECQIKNVAIGEKANRWQLSSPSSDPHGTDTTLNPVSPFVATKTTDRSMATVKLQPISATVIHFE